MDTRISVLIPCYNAAETIGAAIHSILNQSLTHFELIVVDDASTDHSIKVIESIKSNKLQLLRHTENKGIAESRNTLLKSANANYILWLDADDIALPGRLEKQLAFMESHPEVDLAGSWVKLRNSRKKTKKLPTQPDIINKRLLLKNCLIQPSVISKNFYKKEGIYYNPEYNYLEDFELWSRLRETKIFANIPEYLTSYFVPTPAEEATKRANYHFHEKLELILKKNLATLGISATTQELSSLAQFSSGQTPELPSALIQLFDRLRKQKGMKKIIKQLAFENFAISKSNAALYFYLKCSVS